MQWQRQMSEWLQVNSKSYMFLHCCNYVVHNAIIWSRPGQLMLKPMQQQKSELLLVSFIWSVTHCSIIDTLSCTYTLSSLPGGCSATASPHGKATSTASTSCHQLADTGCQV